MADIFDVAQQIGMIKLGSKLLCSYDYNTAIAGEKLYEGAVNNLRLLGLTEGEIIKLDAQITTNDPEERKRIIAYYESNQNKPSIEIIEEIYGSGVANAMRELWSEYKAKRILEGE